jgi:hypothetical protein
MLTASKLDLHAVSQWRETAMPNRRRQKKSSQTGKSEDQKPASILQFPERRKTTPPPDDFFGIVDRELSTNEQFPDHPKLELLPPEKILLGFAVVVAVIMLGVLLLLLISWPPS